MSTDLSDGLGTPASGAPGKGRSPDTPEAAEHVEAEPAPDNGHDASTPEPGNPDEPVTPGDSGSARSDDSDPDRAQAPYEFDANAWVELGDDEPQLERLTSEVLRQALDAGRRHGRDVRKLATFDDGAVSLKAGKIKFVVKRDPFCLAIADACEAVRLPSRGKNAQSYDARLRITESGIKVSTFDLSFFYETTVLGDVSGLAEGQGVAVALNLRQLKKLARAPGPDEALTGVYRADRHELGDAQQLALQGGTLGEMV
jgi:hypothetical protein